MESNKSISEYPSRWDDEQGTDFNEFGQPQTVNFFLEGVKKFHHVRTYNSHGVLTRNVVVKDNI